MTDLIVVFEEYMLFHINRYGTPGGSGVPVAWWNGVGGVGGLLRWASAVCCWCGLLLVRFAAGAVCCWCGGKRLGCWGEKHSKREVPLDRKVIREKVHL